MKNNRLLLELPVFDRLIKLSMRKLILKLSIPTILSVALLPALMLSTAAEALADSASSAPLTKLEDHFFQHTYPADTEDDRLTRIEKLVFGEAKTGDVSSRLNDLQKVVAEADATPGNSSGGSTASNSSSSGNSNSSSDSGTNSGSGPNSNAGSSTASSGDDDPALISTDYPRVDELEKLILNQSNKQMALGKRLSILETKAFGKPSSDDDLSARTDKLETYWEKTLSPGLEKQYLSTVDWLENKVIGQSYSSKPLIERVQTLEGIVFPNQPPDTSSGIKEQLDTLTNAVQISKNTSPGVTPMSSGEQGHSYPGQTAQNQYNSQGQYGQQAQTPPPYPSNYAAPASSQAYGGSSGNPASGQGYGQSYGQTSQAYNPPAYGNQKFQMPNDEDLQPTGSTGNYGGQQSYQSAQSYQQPAYQQSQTGQATMNTASEQQAAQPQQSKGHPLLRGLAKALGTAATMAAGAMSSGMMNMNYGNGMYGNSLYGGGGYSPYGYNTGYGGYNGMGMGMGGLGGYNTGIHF